MLRASVPHPGPPFSFGSDHAETWMGLEVRPESRCSAYDRDIEHVVALSEAHDSGLCAADAATRRRFANDLLNLTLSDPYVNRNQKRDKDAGEWMPRLDRKGFAKTVIRVKLKYGLSIDRREKAALAKALAGDTLAVLADPTWIQVELPEAEEGHPLDLWDDNGNGRITESTAANRASSAPTCAHRLRWATLLARVFSSDLSACATCGGRLRIIAALADSASIRTYLEGIGLRRCLRRGPRRSRSSSSPPDLPS